MVTVSLLLALLSLVLAGAIAGLFYAYWCSVMIALDRARPEAAISVMQTINVVILNPFFFASFFGTLAALPLAAGAALLAGAGASALWLAAAFLVYGIGTFGVTVVRNVPLNNALAALGESADPHAGWRRFADPWNRWNRVRTAAAFAALACVGLALAAHPAP